MLAGTVLPAFQGPRPRHRDQPPARPRLPKRTPRGATTAAPDASQYSALKQINESNVSTLQVAWTYPTGDGGGYLFNPIVVDGMMYVQAKGGSIVALDAATGKELLGLRARSARPHHQSRHELLGEQGPNRAPAAVLQPASSCRRSTRKTGEPITSFGDNGRVDLRDGLDRDPTTINAQSNTPGRVFEDLDHPRLGDQPGLQLGAGRHPRVRRPHRQARLDIPHRAAPRRIRLRHLAAGRVEDRRRRQHLGRAHGRRAARHRLRADRQPQVQLLRRQPATARTCSATA